ncbi:DUF6357 family protein [Agromyces sp. Marseille-Q5079]|uniref:DUF6357 family protein n=1 Tax=Agromyces sp. Marseille-Q5079 TaxID=3439059 RepID=UPI003D9C9EBF
MARPYKPGPKDFVFGVGDGDDQRVSLADPQEAYLAFAAFFGEREADTYSIVDERAGQSLVLLLAHGAIARVEVADRSRTDYLKIDRPNRYMPSVMRFFENGHAGLDHFGQWFTDLADLDASPEVRGAARAATITTEAAAIEEVARIWADSGIVDPTDQYYVFFDSHGLDDDRADRAELIELIGFLGLERLDNPADSPDGEVRVRADPRLDVEFERWS